MSLLNGDIRALFAGTFGAGIYLDGTLTKIVRTEATNGDISETPTDYPMKCHAPSLTESFRVSNGYTDKDIDIIVLQDGVVPEPNSDDRITYMSDEYTVSASVKGDGANSQWRIKCRRA